jgi:predicted nucleic acid-binding protein
MGDILVRNVPEVTVARLKGRAKRHGRSLQAEALAALEAEGPYSGTPSRAHAVRAAELADRLDHSVYDCLYLALAQAEGDVLLTADTAFERKTRVAGLRGRVRLMPV